MRLAGGKAACRVAAKGVKSAASHREMPVTAIASASTRKLATKEKSSRGRWLRAAGVWVWVRVSDWA